jgi:hypothetical protein
MTVVGDDEKSPPGSAFLSVVVVALLVLTGSKSGAPSRSQRPVSQEMEFIKVARGTFFLRELDLRRRIHQEQA